MIDTPSQEFILPFVGRKEELQFLLNEYDQMLHAQYRSVWLEAPAGMGKTTLVEEFLRRITEETSEVLKTSEVLQPWVVHAHLRERSSNSLASFVEALGATLQTLTETQREKLFSGLTSFYQERARKIVGGGNVQSMEMEEAITTSGYILKQLSKYFPVVVIIEDIHVLKGETSFYALRHLLAILEHVPLLTLFISRPLEEKSLQQFHLLLQKEGCRTLNVKSLNAEDVKNLSAVQHSSLPTKELLRLSGGNALLLRELLRSGVHNGVEDGTASTMEKIVGYLKHELQQLSKKDRKVIAVAGMLGEEFSEQLLEDIVSSNFFHCWSAEVLPRLERKGIIRRGEKILRPEREKKEITVRVSTFTHALWLEASRKIYHEEKTWTDKKFAETIVPLLSHEDYPLLTDAELIINLFKWLPRRKTSELLHYTNALCGLKSRWHFHSYSQQKEILDEVEQCISDLLTSQGYSLSKEVMWVMVNLLNAKMSTMSSDRGVVRDLIYKALSNFTNTDKTALWSAAIFFIDDAHDSLHEKGDEKKWHTIRHSLLSLEKIAKRKKYKNESLYISLVLNVVDGFRVWYNNSDRSAELLFITAKEMPWRLRSGESVAVLVQSFIQNLTLPNRKISRYLQTAREHRRKAMELPSSEYSSYLIRVSFRNIIELNLKMGDVRSALKEAESFRPLTEKIWMLSEKYNCESVLLNTFAYAADVQIFRARLEKIINEQFSGVKLFDVFRIAARSLFYMEEWQLFEKQWQEYKQDLFSHHIPAYEIIELLRLRILMTLVCDDDKGYKEATALLQSMSKDYPLTKKLVEKVQEKLKALCTLRESSFLRAFKQYEIFLRSDNTLSPFDRAHFAYLFARIGVKLEHDSKEFSSCVQYALKGFADLGLDKRVIFTAERFFDAKLISKKELQQLQRKHATPEPGLFKTKNEIRNKEEGKDLPTEGTGVKLFYFGKTLTAIGPDGNSISSERFGKRQSTSSQKKTILLELIRGALDHRPVTRRRLLNSLYPNVRSGVVSEKRIAKLDRHLSAYLSQLKATFASYPIFEKTEGGYRLLPTVKLDIMEMKKNLSRAKSLEQLHAPSALWMLHKVQETLRNAESMKEKFFKHEVKETLLESNNLLSKVRKRLVL